MISTSGTCAAEASLASSSPAEESDEPMPVSRTSLRKTLRAIVAFWAVLFRFSLCFRLEKWRPLRLCQTCQCGTVEWEFGNIPVLVSMLRSHTTFCARVRYAKVVAMRTSLAWGSGKSACPLCVVIAVSLVFFGYTAEVASGDLDRRRH